MSDLGEVKLSRTYKAPRELVFEVMTTPEHLQHFWGPVGLETPLENIVVEPHVGGRFETGMVSPDGEVYWMRGVFVEFDPPNRIAWTTEPGVDDGMISTVTFTDLGDGTTEAFTHQTNVPEYYRTPENLEGMQTSFDKCEAYLATL